MFRKPFTSKIVLIFVNIYRHRHGASVAAGASFQRPRLLFRRFHHADGERLRPRGIDAAGAYLSLIGSYSRRLSKKMILSFLQPSARHRNTGTITFCPPPDMCLRFRRESRRGADADANILSAISGKNNKHAHRGTSYSDLRAAYISSDDGTQSCIIYVKDSLDEVEKPVLDNVSIIIQAFFNRA